MKNFIICIADWIELTQGGVQWLEWLLCPDILISVQLFWWNNFIVLLLVCSAFLLRVNSQLQSIMRFVFITHNACDFIVPNSVWYQWIIRKDCIVIIMTVKLTCLLFSWLFVGRRVWWSSYRFIKFRNFTGACTGRFGRQRWIWSSKTRLILFCCLPSLHIFLHCRLRLSVCGRYWFICGYPRRWRHTTTQAQQQCPHVWTSFTAACFNTTCARSLEQHWR